MFENGDLILRYLEALGVEYVFGVPGGSIEPFYNALARSERRGGIRAVVARHESGAAFMAEGYSRETGKLGVCCSTAGPGATNLITGVASAYADSIPMLVISAQTSLNRFGQGSLQESSCTSINTVEMFSRCTRFNTLVSHPDQLEPKLLQAISYAMSNQPGPVHLGIPLDIMRHPVSEPPGAPSLCAFVDHEVAPAPAILQRLTQELASISRATVVLGEGAAGAVDILITLAESKGWKIVTTPRGKGLIDSCHPLYCGVFGFAGHDSAVEALKPENAEIVLVVGTALDEVSTAAWDPGAILSERLIHLSHNPEHLSRSTMARLVVLGSPRLALKPVVEYLTSDRPSHFSGPEPATDDLPLPAHTLLSDRSKCFPQAGKIKPQALMTYLSQTCPPTTRVLMDSGNSFLWGIHYWNIRLPEGPGSHQKLFHIGIGFASMGWAIGASVGMAAGAKGAPVICVTGDGSYLMAGQEITTALQENLNLLMVVLNDSSLGMVQHGQALGGAEATASKLPNINYAMLAESMGIESYTAETLEDLEALDIAAILARPGPCLLNILIDGDEVPPMGSRMKVLTGAV
ncbi:thiamine pyrophosphate-binding protein [Marinobacter sp. ANT_B65]|uniref:thiamine pyrophosphate-binding protein n=1 Tax=Marinobacter sp. ANT_B65 TaxID=2039467 RepID=UPI000BBF1007|nr:thiamine pyrophosphate-binding protein [Marinobacter sp. ANT_B65]PCM45871.1 thiamine pyrophosphate-binding protein [Marinobacter sp. ANT_B65]